MNETHGLVAVARMQKSVKISYPTGGLETSRYRNYKWVVECPVLFLFEVEFLLEIYERNYTQLLPCTFKIAPS